jgi:hypothetical protein
MVLDYGPYRWLPLDLCDRSRVAGDLAAIMDVAEARLQGTLGQILETVVARHQRLGGMQSLTFVAFDALGQALGWTGLTAQQPPHTATYLVPEAWGTGLNLWCKSLVWELAMLGNIERVAMSIDERNVRSVRGNRKLFPDSPISTAWDERRQRTSVTIIIDRPPVGYQALDRARRGQLADLIDRCALAAP